MDFKQNSQVAIDRCNFTKIVGNVMRLAPDNVYRVDHALRLNITESIFSENHASSAIIQLSGNTILEISNTNF